MVPVFLDRHDSPRADLLCVVYPQRHDLCRVRLCRNGLSGDDGLQCALTVLAVYRPLGRNPGHPAPGRGGGPGGQRPGAGGVLCPYLPAGPGGLQRLVLYADSAGRLYQNSVQPSQALPDPGRGGLYRHGQSGPAVGPGLFPGAFGPSGRRHCLRLSVLFPVSHGLDAPAGDRRRRRGGGAGPADGPGLSRGRAGRSQRRRCAAL